MTPETLRSAGPAPIPCLTGVPRTADASQSVLKARDACVPERWSSVASQAAQGSLRVPVERGPNSPSCLRAIAARADSNAPISLELQSADGLVLSRVVALGIAVAPADSVLCIPPGVTVAVVAQAEGDALQLTLFGLSP